MGGGSAPSVPFEQVGDTVTGIITSPPEKRVQTDEDGNPKTFKSGDVKYMWMVRIQTSLRNPQDPFDTGERGLFLKWKSLEAVQTAVRASGAKSLQVGGTLTLTLAGFGQRASAMYSPPKLWTAHYTPAPDNFLGDPQPAQQYAQPQYQQQGYAPQYADPQQYTQPRPTPYPDPSQPTPAPRPQPQPVPVQAGPDTRTVLEKLAAQNQEYPRTPPLAPQQDTPPF